MKSGAIRKLLLLLLTVLVLGSACSRAETGSADKEQAAEQMELAQKYLKEENYEQAISAFKKSIELDAKNAEAYLKLGEIYRDLGKMEDMVAILAKGYENTKDAEVKARYAASCAELGLWYSDSGDYEEAVSSYQKAIELDPQNVDTYLGFYEVYMAMEEYERADAVLEKGYAATEDESLKEVRLDSLLSLGQQGMEEENYESAILFLEKYLAAGGEDAEAVVSLSSAYLSVDEFELAMETLEKFGDPENEGIRQAMAAVNVRYGMQCFDDGDNANAIPYLKQAMELAPDGMEAYTVLISVYLETDKLDEAGKIVAAGVAKFLQPGVDTSSENFYNFLNIVSEYYSVREDMDGGLGFWQKVAAIDPGNDVYQDEIENYRTSVADSAYVKAEELLENGDAVSAMTYFKKAFSLTPDNFDDGLLFADRGTYCLNKDGSFRTGWYESVDDGSRYYFSSEVGPGFAQALTGWQEIGGSYYYFDTDGMLYVDDVTPDGHHVGADGKLVAGESLDDDYEAEEEESEEEESEEAEEETSASSGSKNQSQTNTQTNTQTQTSSKGGLKLNVDTLRSIKDEGSFSVVSADELFLGLGSTLTMNDIYNCMNQYGLRVEWISDEAPYQIGMGDMVIWIQPGDNWLSAPTVVRDAAKYKETVRAKALPEGVTFNVWFGADSVNGNETVNLTKIESVNKK